MQLDIFAKNPRILYFDLETLRSADEVGGWGNIADMGMACGVTFDSLDNAFHVYLEHQVDALIDSLLKADLVIGYNHLRFDYKVLSSYTDKDLLRGKNFDMLVDVNKRLGHRLKLDQLAQASLGVGKSADGLQSLRWVKEGAMDKVVEYCKQDVAVTRDVFLFGLTQQKLLYTSRDDGHKTLVVDWAIDKLLAR